MRNNIIVSMSGIILILFLIFVCVTGWLIESEKVNNRLVKQIEQLKEEKPVERITLTESITLIRNSDDYIYLNKLEINKDKLEQADKHTDINGIMWWEVMEDGYIKVYVEGHVMPDSIHWYAPY
jgi:biopolymer transport protein ExbD